MDAEFSPGSKTVILGGNGSGKSTFLQLLSGFLSPSEGELSYSENEVTIDQDKLFKLVAIASPYSAVPEDFTLRELIDFQSKLKPFQKGLSSERIEEALGLAHHSNKLIRHYSSGMKQRVKLGMAILSTSPLLLLDEPTSNLDREGISWFTQLIEQYASSRTLVICSNHKEAEMAVCTSQLNISDYKSARL